MNAPALSASLERLCEASEAKIAALARRYGLDPEAVRGISAADPAGGPYTEWLVRQVRSGGYRFPEDADKAREQLAWFHGAKGKSTYAGERDVNRLDAAGLYRLSREHGGTVGRKEQVRISADEGAKPVCAANGVELWRITTPEAATRIARGTNWCIVDPKFFHQYGPPFFLLLDAATGEKLALFHEGSEGTWTPYGDDEDEGEMEGEQEAQLKAPDDSDVDPVEIGRLVPVLARAGLVPDSGDYELTNRLVLWRDALEAPEYALREYGLDALVVAGVVAPGLDGPVLELARTAVSRAEDWMGRYRWLTVCAYARGREQLHGPWEELRLVWDELVAAGRGEDLPEPAGVSD